MINPNIFRAYDIRGSSFTDVTPITAYKIGFCFGKIHSSPEMTTDFLYKSKIYVGRDGRLSSPSLYEALVKGLTKAGANVISIGIVPTPTLYFADKQFQPTASIMITGSHNKKDDNGFKLLSGGKSFFASRIQDLFELIQKTDWGNHPYVIANDSRSQSQEIKNPSLPRASYGNVVISEDIHHKSHEIATVPTPLSNKDMSKASLLDININEAYIDRILDGLIINPKLKVAWDPGNGSAGTITEMLKKRLPNNNIIINSDIDGNFPNHHPDPTILGNLKQLIDITVSENCDIGIGFDGDADRIGVVTNKGEMIYGDQILCIFAKDLLSYNKNGTIIMDVKASQVIFDQIKLYGGNPIMWKTGHPLIKTKMLETNAVLGGEMSGHIFFADKYYGYDDGIYAGLRFLDLLSRSNHSLSEMLHSLPKAYSTEEIKIAVSEKRKFQIIDEIKMQIIRTGIDFIDIDGVRVNTEHGWWLIRASNTNSELIARCESSSQEGLEILKSNLCKILDQFP